MSWLKAKIKSIIRLAVGVAMTLGLTVSESAPWSIGASHAADPFNLKSDVPIIRRGLNAGLDSLSDNSSAGWTNPATGNSGTLMPRDRMSDQIGRICRNYLRTWTVNNGTTTIRGLACREAAGYWRVQSETNLGRVENTPAVAQAPLPGSGGLAAGGTSPTEPARRRPPRQRAARSSSPPIAAPPSAATAPAPAAPPGDLAARDDVPAASAPPDGDSPPVESPLASIAAISPAVEPPPAEVPLAQLPTRSVLRMTP